MSPSFEIICTATATIRERWLIRADCIDHAYKMFEDHFGESEAVFVSDEVLDDERDREIETVSPFDGKWPDEPDNKADAAQLLQDAMPAILEFLGTMARMETAREFDDRTDGEGMSGDDAVETVSNLIGYSDFDVEVEP